MTRWKAATIHLAISAAVILTISMLVLWLWYPPELLPMSRLGNLIAVIAAVDVVAGPLLTLIVYKHGKSTLRFDLSVIAIVQVVLLGYGLHTLAQVRPVFLVGAVDSFDMVAANEIAASDLAQAQPPFNRLSWTGPKRVGAVLPLDSSLRSAILNRALAGNDVQAMPKYYVPFERVKSALLERAQPLQLLLDAASEEEKETLMRRTGNRQVDAIRFLPINGSRGSALMLIDASSGEPIAPVGIEPWALLSRRNDPKRH